jgi:hypothetical protein
LYDPCLLLVFAPFRGKSNAFASRYVAKSIPYVVALPLTVTKTNIKRIIDLRDPRTANWAASNLSRLEYRIGDRRVKPFPNRPRIDSFSELLPTLLEQSLGGCTATNIFGDWLRRIGAQGLVYPSARVDARVDMQAGKMVGSEGFCFVEYSGTGPLGLCGHDHSPEWPKYVQCTPAGPGKEHEPTLEFKDVKMIFDHDGPAAGSWRVQGLKTLRILLWRLSRLQILLHMIYDTRSDTMFSSLFQCLIFGGVRHEIAARIAFVLEEALFGVPDQIVLLERVAGDITQVRGGHVFRELYQDAAKAAHPPRWWQRVLPRRKG